MNTLIKVVTHIVVFSIGCGLLFLTYLIPAFQAIDWSVHGWGWVILIVVTFALAFARGFVNSLFELVLQGLGLLPPAAVCAFISDVADFAQFALILFISATIAPSLVSYSSIGAIVVLCALIGVVYSSCNSISRRLRAKG